MNRSHSLWPLVLGIVLMATTASRTATSQKLDIAVKDRANAYASLAASGQFVAIAWGASAMEGSTDIYIAVSRDGGRVFGAPRRVLVRFGDGRSREITLDEAALAVSSPNASSRPPEHAGYYLRTGAPVQMRPAAVVAPSAAVADALATCALLLGTELDHCLFGQLSAILIGVNVR